MAKPKNLATMSLDALIKLRDDVTELLGKQADAIQEQLARLMDLGHGGRAPNKLRGRRVAVKYQDKNGNTWSGRGAQPRWMTAAIKAGAKRDDFLVGKIGKNSAKKAEKPATKAKKSAKKARPARKVKIAKRTAERAKPARTAKRLAARPKVNAAKPAKRPNPRTRAKTKAAAQQVNTPIPQPQPTTDEVPASTSA